MKELKLIVEKYEEQKNNGPLALATVVAVKGSSYRSPGAKMLITSNGRWFGAVSGGCLEGDALRQARVVMQTGQPKCITYDTTTDDLGVGLGCKGIIDIYIEPITDASFFTPLYQALSNRAPKLLVTVLGSADQMEFGKCLIEGAAVLSSTIKNEALHATIQNQIVSVLKDKGSSLVDVVSEGNSYQFFVERLMPVIKLVVFGGGPDVKPVTQFASMLNWEVVVTDECVAHTAPACFPHADVVLHSLSKDVVEKINFDPYTACLLMSHNYGYDKAVLKLLHPIGLPYIGVMGPKKRSKELLEELAIENQAIHSPVGLDLGSETPDEIALSVIAEIQAVFNGRDGGPLKEKKTPIHRRNSSFGHVFKHTLVLNE